MPVMSIIVSLAACSTFPSYICDAQARTGLDPRLLYSICLVESKGNVKAFVKHDGASASYGVCQIKLNTARSVGFIGSYNQLMDPSVNALFAAKYIQKHLKRFKALMPAISAYNAGRPISGNAAYVNNVLSNYNRLGGMYERTSY